MTAYNRESFISEAIESILNSTYPNYELIIVDDCSTDKTLDIAYGFSRKYSNVKVYVNEKNLGDYPNRNKAAFYANGKYLKYLDSDDIMYPHCLEVMVGAMEKFQEAVIGISQNLAEDIKPYPILLSPLEAYTEQYFTRNILLYGPTGSIFRREPFFKNGGFQEVRHDGDSLTALKLAAQYPMVKIQPGLIWWRRHSFQENKYRPRKSMHFEILENALRTDHCPFSNSEKRKAMDHIKKTKLKLKIVKTLKYIKNLK